MPRTAAHGLTSLADAIELLAKSVQPNDGLSLLIMGILEKGIEVIPLHQSNSIMYGFTLKLKK